MDFPTDRTERRMVGAAGLTFMQIADSLFRDARGISYYSRMNIHFLRIIDLYNSLFFLADILSERRVSFSSRNTQYQLS